MVAPAIGSIGSWLLLRFALISADRVLFGPLGFRVPRSAPPGQNLAHTLLQMLMFWVIFLIALPGALLFLETRWGLHVGFPVG